ncbi:MAG: type II toxin-antitoxin system RelE/ParE family toxin [Acinetobacter sp.]|nr:type II toxin-antitoxin system RelE/ParE family toxin [Acinetobacter sp.]
MYTILLTEPFKQWLDSIKDSMTKRRLIRRLEKAVNGHLGDIKPVGQAVYEMREFFGSGYRMYYIRQGNTIIVMLGGGDKSSQQQDIQQAIELSKKVKYDEIDKI